MGETVDRGAEPRQRPTMPALVRLELLTDDELARSFRTFAPEPHETVVHASLFVSNGRLVIESDDAALVAYLHEVIDEAADDAGRLQLPGYHTSKRVGGGTLNKHYPGDFVSPVDVRYPEALARALCFVGEREPTRRYQGRVLHAFVDRQPEEE